eukprot:CFRG2615T1
MTSLSTDVTMVSPQENLRGLLMQAWNERWSPVKWCRIMSSILYRSEELTREVKSNELCDVLLEQLLVGDFCSPLFVEYMIQAAGSNLLSRRKMFRRLMNEADPSRPSQFATVVMIIDIFVDYLWQNSTSKRPLASLTLETTTCSLDVAHVLLGTLHLLLKAMNVAVNSIVTHTRKNKKTNPPHVDGGKANVVGNGVLSDGNSDEDEDERELLQTNANRCAQIVLRMTTDNRTISLLAIAKNEYPADWRLAHDALISLHEISNPRSNSGTAAKKRGISTFDTYRFFELSTRLRISLFGNLPLSALLSAKDVTRNRISTMQNASSMAYLCSPTVAYYTHLEMSRRSLVGLDVLGRVWRHIGRAMSPMKRSDFYATIILTSLKAIITRQTNPHDNEADDSVCSAGIDETYWPSMLSLQTFLLIKVPLIIREMVDENEDTGKNSNMRKSVNTNRKTNSNTRSSTDLNSSMTSNANTDVTLDGGLETVHNMRISDFTANTGTDTKKFTTINTIASSQHNVGANHTVPFTNGTASNMGEDDNADIDFVDVALDMNVCDRASPGDVKLEPITNQHVCSPFQTITRKQDVRKPMRTRPRLAVERAFESVCSSQVLLAGAQACSKVGCVAECLGRALVNEGLLDETAMMTSLRSHGHYTEECKDMMQNAHHTIPPKSASTVVTPQTNGYVGETLDVSDTRIGASTIEELVELYRKNTLGEPLVVITSLTLATLVQKALRTHARVYLDAYHVSSPYPTCMETELNGRVIKQESVGVNVGAADMGNSLESIEAILRGLQNDAACSFSQRAFVVANILNDDLIGVLVCVLKQPIVHPAAPRTSGLEKNTNTSASVVRCWLELVACEWVREVVWSTGLGLQYQTSLQSLLDTCVPMIQASCSDASTGVDEPTSNVLTNCGQLEIYELCRLLLFTQHLEMQVPSTVTVGCELGVGLLRKEYEHATNSWVDLAVADPETAIEQHNIRKRENRNKIDIYTVVESPIETLIESFTKAVYVTQQKESATRSLAEVLVHLPLVSAAATQLAMRTCSTGGIEYKTVVEGLRVLNDVSPTAIVSISCYLCSELCQTWDVDLWSPEHSTSLSLPQALLNDLMKMVTNSNSYIPSQALEATLTPISEKLIGNVSADVSDNVLKRSGGVINGLLMEALHLNPVTAETLSTTTSAKTKLQRAATLSLRDMSKALQNVHSGIALNPEPSVAIADFACTANPSVLVETLIQDILGSKFAFKDCLRMAHISAAVISSCPGALGVLCSVVFNLYAPRLDTVNQADALAVLVARTFANECYGGMQDNTYLRQCARSLFDVCDGILKWTLKTPDMADLQAYLVIQTLTGLSEMPLVISEVHVPFLLLCENVFTFGMEPVLLCDMKDARARIECANFYCE